MTFRWLLVSAVVVMLIPLGSCTREEPETAAWALSECLGCTESEELVMCMDELDNDDDQLVDCEDPDCEGIGCCGLSGSEDNDEACSDGCDNDGNGYVDCLDYGCTKSDKVTACRSKVKTDETSALACSDGIDNDWDGYFDCKDFDCVSSQAVNFCEGDDRSCSDGIDNDGNGFIDCKDYGCSQSSKVTVCK